MNFLDGLKTIWSDPEIRKTAIKSTVAAVAATGVATYAVTRAATRKQRKANEAYLAEPKTTMVDGELYKKMPDGTLRKMRMNSYDLFDREYADFIVLELIPYVIEKYELKISSSPRWKI